MSKSAPSKGNPDSEPLLARAAEAPPRAVERVIRDVTARGVRMRVLEAGPDDAPPLLLLHGFLMNHETFDDVIDRFAQRFRVIAPDLPGFGESEKPNPSRYPYGVEAFAESAADLMAAFGLGRSFVVGHAMGGAVALTLAARQSELIERLVLISPLCYPFTLPLKGRLTLLPVVGAFLFKQLYGRAMFRAYFREQVYGPKAGFPTERVDRHYAHFNTPSARESAYAVMHAIIDTRTVVALLPRIDVSSLVVWGGDDPLFPSHHASRLVRELRGAHLQIMDTGHAPHEERPGELVEVITEFLEGRRSR